MPNEQLRILSTDLLQQARPLVNEFRALSGKLAIPLGWHYLLDLPWAAQELSHLQPGMRVLDAGAGRGLMQWWLSDHHIDVISVDRVDRSNLSRRMRSFYPISGMRAQDLLAPPPIKLREIPRFVRASAGSLFSAAVARDPGRSKGRITIYNHGLDHMPDVPDASVDAIVSISSLEHNTPEGLQGCVKELMRVLKPGGKLVATLGAGKATDWFHEPSKGWCYTDATLRRIFDLPASAPSNYDQYDELMEKLRASEELKGDLAAIYFKGGNNGMPWGKWDPQYQSVGVVKVKPAQTAG